MLVMDETKGQEGVYLIHKTGARIEIDSNGSVKTIAKDGSYTFLDATTDTISATSSTGSVLSIGNQISMIQSSGGDMVTIAKGQVQVNSTGNVTINAASVVLSGSTFSAVLGEQLAKYLDGHLHSTVMGPSGPPINTTAMNNANPSSSFLSQGVKLQ
jgi:hypothetical protein